MPDGVWRLRAKGSTRGNNHSPCKHLVNSEKLRCNSTETLKAGHGFLSFLSPQMPLKDKEIKEILVHQEQEEGRQEEIRYLNVLEDEK